MPFPLKPAASLLIAAAMISSLSFGVHRYRYRFVRSDSDLVALLPKSDATTFFANIAAVRNAGLLGIFAQTQRIDDPEYGQFVRQTGFSYERDLETIAGSADDKQLIFAIRGRFDWLRLRNYAEQHGGECHGSTCSAPTSKPGRWASYKSIQPNVMVLAVSEDRNAAVAISPPKDDHRKIVSEAPLWVKPSHLILQSPMSLPLAIRIFAISLQSAQSVVLSLSPDEAHTGDLSIHLQAHFPNEATAEATRNQLEIQTKMLKLELGRENKQPNPGDLSGLMTAGFFQVVNGNVFGVWPVRKELLKSLE